MHRAIVSWFLKLQSRLGVRRQWVDAFGKEITFGWSCGNETEAEAILASAVSMLVDLIPSICSVAKVQSLRFLNPESETGFFLDRSCLRKITSDFGPESARLLLGERVDYGTILVNGDLCLENLHIDARSSLAGHFSVQLPSSLQEESLVEKASKFGFQIQGK